MKPLLLLALLLAPCAAGCKHSTSNSSTEHTETSSVTDTTLEEHGSQTTTTVVTEAPGTTTTTVSEYAPPEKETAAPEEAADAGAQRQPLASGRPTTPRHGPLVKRTVTVVKSGGETTQTSQQAVTQGTAATETKAAGKSDVTAKAHDEGGPSAGCIGSSWLIGVGIVLFAAALVLGIIKWRRAV